MNKQLNLILKNEGLENLIPLFNEQGITDSELAELTDVDLRDMGIDKLGERKRLIIAFSRAAARFHYDEYWVDVIGGALPPTSGIPCTRVEPFLISEYQITMEEWQMIRTWALPNQYVFREGAAGKVVISARRGKWCPATNVSWYDVVKWCNAKSEMEGLTPVYEVNYSIYKSGEFGDDGSHQVTMNERANGHRLPTGEEWEWAAMGNINKRLVGAVPSIELGMSGELFEWCWNLMDNSTRMVRRGFWSNTWTITNVPNSYLFEPSYFGDNITSLGFRIARSRQPADNRLE